jgi:lysozyme
MIIKSPPCYDVSHWKEISDFKAVSPKPLLMITKATEGVSLVDSKFVRFFQGMKEAGILRGVYHFNRKLYDGAGQARHFVNVVQGYVTAKDILILDVEEGGEKTSQLWSFFETVRARFPYNLLMLYSRRNILEQLIMTVAEKEYFKRIVTWPAGYPTNPDIYNTVPNFYVPDPTRFGPVWLWQYSAHGAVDGIVGDVDLNLMSSDLVSYLGAAPEPTPAGETMFYGRNKTTLTNIRPLPNGNPPDLGDIYLNDLVEADRKDASGVWWHLTKLTRANGAPVALPAEAWAYGVNIEPIAPPVVTPADSITVSVDMDITAKVNGVQYVGTAIVGGVVLNKV